MAEESLREEQGLLGFAAPELREELELVNRHMERLCRSNNPSMQRVMDWVLSARGKQLRPILTLLCAKLKGKQADVSELAAVVEICHTASLIHDDIVDDADFRRGQPSAAKKFGKEMAVYAGDFMIFVTLGRTELRLKPWYKDMFQNLELMCDGELAQFDTRYDTELTEEQYVEHIIGKTSSMFCIACESGAYEGGCSEKERQAVHSFAVKLGLLFQMRDDLRDFLSSTQAALKTVQSDFRSGYYTLPAIRAFAHPACGPALRELARKTRIGQFEPADAEKTLELIRLSDGFQYTRERICQYAAQAREALSPFAETGAKRKLLELVDHLLATTPAEA